MIDAFVLGSGLAELVAARELAAAGADVLVLEARDRVGVWSRSGSTAAGRCSSAVR